MTDLGGLGRLIGDAGSNPVSARRFRSAAITVHTLDPASTWRWRPQEALGDEKSLLAYVQSPVRIGVDDQQSTAEAGFFLHPHRAYEVSVDEPASVLCIWVPWSVIEELDDGTFDGPPELVATPLMLGLRAFANAVVGRASQPTIYTEFLVEKLLAEMVFGAVLEAGRGELAVVRDAPAREARPIERARTLMLIRRGDSAFGVEELARELHLSTRQLQRVFAAAGSSPADELRRLRAELAQQLLDDATYSPLTVEEIAAHSGFGTAAALRRAFSALGLSSPRRRG